VIPHTPQNLRLNCALKIELAECRHKYMHAWFAISLVYRSGRGGGGGVEDLKMEEVVDGVDKTRNIGPMYPTLRPNPTKVRVR
jgi:hypothetical protein